MMREAARLIQIRNKKAVTKDTDPEFFFSFQRSLLLALKEQDILDETQYRYAEEKLQDQRREAFRKMGSGMASAREGGRKP